MIGGRIDTGVAPNAVRSVPKPTFMMRIWATRSWRAMPFSVATSRATAPHSNITPI